MINSKNMPTIKNTIKIYKEISFHNKYSYTLNFFEILTCRIKHLQEPSNIIKLKFSIRPKLHSAASLASHVEAFVSTNP